MIEIILVLLVLFVLWTIAKATISFAPWVPTRKKDLERIFKLAALKSGEVFYDLGCGDGRLVFHAARNFGVKAIGVELAVPWFLFCKLKQLVSPSIGVSFRYGNLFRADTKDADVIYIFGMPDKISARLADKFKSELRPETRVISSVFNIAGWQAKDVDKGSGGQSLPIYLYKID